MEEMIVSAVVLSRTTSRLPAHRPITPLARRVSSSTQSSSYDFRTLFFCALTTVIVIPPSWVICNANYEVIAWTMNCPGCRNDCTAFKFSGFHELLRKLPDRLYVLGDASYPPQDKVFVPFPDTKLTPRQDTYNFYQSQCRMSVEQIFRIIVRAVLEAPARKPLIVLYMCAMYADDLRK